MLRWNHYEMAFEAYLKERKIPFLAMAERYRNPLDDGSTLKNLDFVISRSVGTSWLIDVKGRKFPGGKSGGYWKHWTTRDDLVGLRHWEKMFGERFSGLFVFAYLICGSKSPLPERQLFSHRERLYGFVGISVTDYLTEIRLLSPKWRTFAMPTERFKQLAKPFEDFIAS
jgi:hypothetical protein